MKERYKIEAKNNELKNRHGYAVALYALINQNVYQLSLQKTPDEKTKIMSKNIFQLDQKK